ncbi:ferritin subunit [Asbolus verrucosus]|uniref:Ferritin n=1 Tax=Asbolus verrucosus TaxID=1661398 RepID=A0A482VYI3_ASBVE|nr:ferritin subunit [Asbolus verrucosus]
MKAILTATLLLCTFALGKNDQLKCSGQEQVIVTDPNWTDMSKNCTTKMKDQIQREINAAMQYLAMGAHFSRDVVNRPGFAKMFFEAASEERQHAIKLISYLLMRGELISEVSHMIRPYSNVKKNHWSGNGAEALKAALELEAFVTKSIKNVIKVCEEEPKNNDYHLVDYLTGEFLEEQYKGQRDLAGKFSTLSKLLEKYERNEKHGALGEFLFDKKLLKGELL